MIWKGLFRGFRRWTPNELGKKLTKMIMLSIKFILVQLFAEIQLVDQIQLTAQFICDFISLIGSLTDECKSLINPSRDYAILRQKKGYSKDW